MQTRLELYRFKDPQNKIQKLNSQSFPPGKGGDVGEGFAAGALVPGGGGRQHEGDSRQHLFQPGQEEGDL